MRLQLFLMAARFFFAGIVFVGLAFTAHAATPDISQNGLAVWLAADAGVTADKNGNVSQWVNQAPNAPPPGSSHPIVKAETWNGKPVLHFEQTPFVTIDQTTSGGTDFSLFLIRSHPKPPTAASAGGSNDENLKALQDELRESTMRRRSNAQPISQTSDIFSTNPELISVVRSGGTIKYYANGDLVATPDSSLTDLASAGASQAIFSGDMAEVILYSRGLSHGERVRVEKYLADKYGAYHPNASWVQTYAPEVQDQIDANQWNSDQARAYVNFIAEAGPVIPKGLRLWLRADKGVQADKENKVTAWQDQSPGRNPCYLPANLPSPELATGSLNGQPSIKFEGNTHLETQNVVTSGQDFSVFVVSSLENAGGPFYNGDSARNGWGFFRSGSGGPYGMLFGAVNEPTFAPLQNPDKPQLLSATRSGGVTHFYAYGNAAGETTSGMGDPASVATVGGLRSGANFTGNVAEILVYNVALNDADRKKMESYLMTKYDLPGNSASASTNQAPVAPLPPQPAK